MQPEDRASYLKGVLDQMAKFALASDAEQAARAKRKTAESQQDLTAYSAFLASHLIPTVGKNGLPEGTSKWAHVDLDAGDSERAEKRRFTAAAKLLNVNLRVDKDKENKTRFWLCVWPKRTRAKNGEAKNGKAKKVVEKK